MPLIPQAQKPCWLASSACDTTVTINLSFYPQADSSLQMTLCPDESILINGTEEYNQANPIGTEILAGASTNGCDSTVTILLQFLAASSELFDTTICKGETILFNGELLADSGEYEYALASTMGCDSILYTLRLTVVDPSPPLLADDEAVVDANELTTNLNIIENDEFTGEVGNDWELVLLSSPANGSNTVSGDGDLTFTLNNPDAFGQDSFHYTICHAVCPLRCDTAIVSLFIEQDCFEDDEEERVNVFTPNGDAVNEPLLTPWSHSDWQAACPQKPQAN
ncbi:MAG: hypothetical protein IPN76_26055 [Saprospiraceae bacterium]|nr:hypothetical protein [Saprospiraceae bacterium]